MRDAVLEWQPFWEKVLPELVSAAQALHRRFASDPQGAIVEIRKIKDHWAGAEQENEDFSARIRAVEDQQLAAAAEPQDDEPELDDEPERNK